jgi:hypothetical protein
MLGRCRAVWRQPAGKRQPGEVNMIKTFAMGVTLALAAVVLFGADGPATAQQRGPAEEIANIKDNI